MKLEALHVHNNVLLFPMARGSVLETVSHIVTLCYIHILRINGHVVESGVCNFNLHHREQRSPLNRRDAVDQFARLNFQLKGNADFLDGERL
jgi:hypothetical protein